MKQKLSLIGAVLLIGVGLLFAADVVGIVSTKSGLVIGANPVTKIGFFHGTTPVAKQANTVKPRTALQNYGLMASGGTDTTAYTDANNAFTGTNTFPAGGGTGTYKPSGRLYSTGTPVATGANTTETDGISYTVPPNTLSANGQFLRFRFYGTTGATANNKTVQVYWGGTSVFSTGAVAANNKPWFLNVAILRTGAGGQAIFVEGQFNATAVAAVTTQTKDETTALVLKNTMTNGTAAAADATTSGGSIEYLP
jgi:hypothetical protein